MPLRAERLDLAAQQPPCRVVELDGHHYALIVDLARSLCEHLAKKELEGRTIGIKVRLDDWTTVTRARTLDHPTNELVLVRDVALELLRAYDPPRPVRLLGVRVAGFEEKGPAAPTDQLALPV